MTGEYEHAIVMAKLRHCAKFRCNEVLHRIVDGVLGQEGEREREKWGRSPMKKGVRKASDQAARTRHEKRGRTKQDETVAVVVLRLKQEGQCAARPEAEARAGATGSDLVILSLAIPPGPLSRPLLFLQRCRDTSTLPLVHLAIKSEL